MKKLFASVLVGAMMLMGTNAFAQLSVGGGYINSTETSTYTVGNFVKNVSTRIISMIEIGYEVAFNSIIL